MGQRLQHGLEAAMVCTRGHGRFPLRRLAADITAALLSAGCLSTGSFLFPRASTQAEKYGIPFVEPLLITGRVRVGPADLAGNSGGALIGNAGAGLTTAAPLAETAALDTMGRMGTITLLSGAAPLGTLAQFRIMAEDEVTGPTGPTGQYVEAIDLDDGARIGYGRLAENGTYKVQVPVADYDRGLAIQVTGLSDGKVTGFLAAPVRVPANLGTILRLDITPATSAILYSEALLAGVRGELEVDKGFRAFTSEGLAYLVRTGDTPNIVKAAEKLDSAPDMQEFENGNVAQFAIVALAQKLARASATHGLRSGTSFLDLTAGHRAVIKEVTRNGGPADAAVDVVDQAERIVTDASVAKAKAEVAKIQDDQDHEWNAVTVLPTPTPARPPPPPHTPHNRGAPPEPHPTPPA